ncbi:hypothetical protein GCM10027596_39590 [Nocardioides korecus]
MTQSSPTTPQVEIMWRPGCPFCGPLRRGLRRAGVVTVEHDITSSVDAATRVRAATGGDETVPTVFVGPRALVNPSVDQVMAAIGAADPAHQATPPGDELRPEASGVRSSRNAGPLWTLAVAVAWVALVAWRPTTTWHLAPLLVAAAWPWVVGQDLCAGDPTSRRRVLVAGAGGLAAGIALTALLALAGRLQGPTWTGAGTPVGEALLLTGTGALTATLVGVVRALRRTTTASARLGTQLLASSPDVVFVEGNPYFPLASVAADVLQPSRTTSVCPWKGIASYYDVHVDDQVIPDGAWTYRHPLPLARRVKGRVAFWRGVEVDQT